MNVWMWLINLRSAFLWTEIGSSNRDSSEGRFKGLFSYDRRNLSSVPSLTSNKGRHFFFLKLLIWSNGTFSERRRTRCTMVKSGRASLSVREDGLIADSSALPLRLSVTSWGLIGPRFLLDGTFSSSAVWTLSPPHTPQHEYEQRYRKCFRRTLQGRTQLGHRLFVAPQVTEERKNFLFLKMALEWPALLSLWLAANDEWLSSG